MKKLVFLFGSILLTSFVYAQTTIWSEGFETYSTGNETGTDVNTNDVGNDWSTASTGVGTCGLGDGNANDYFNVLATTFMTGSRCYLGRDMDGEAKWTSESINISGYTNVSISIDLDESGGDNGSDYVRAYYSIDGGGETLLTNGNQSGNFNGATATASGLSGTTLQIFVYMNNNGGNDYGTFDEILVQGDPDNGTFTSASISLSDVVLSNTATYTYTQTVPSSGTKDYDITSGGTVTLTIPNGDFSSATTAGSTFNGSAIASFTTQTATTLEFNAPVAVSEGNSFTIVIAGVTNHSVAGVYNTASVTAANDQGATNVYSAYSYTLTPAPPRVCDFSYKKTITTNNAQVSGSSNLTNFPMLVSFTDNDLRTTANGGRVENANGYDIVFRGVDCDCVLDHQIEKYDATTGEYIAWVEVPTLKYNSDTEIEMYYGNAAVSTDYSTTGVWDANYVGIWHLHDDFNDATANGNNATNSGSNDITGKIGDGQDFNGSSDFVNCGNDASLSISSTWSMEAWIYPHTVGVDYQAIISKGTGSRPPSMWVSYNDAQVWYDPTGFVAQASNPFSINNWYHYVITRNSSNQVKIYVNGALVNTTNSTATPSTNVSNNLYLGSREGASYEFNGYIDEAKVSNIDRSDDWIATEYNNQNTPGSFYSVGAESSILCDSLFSIGSGNIGDQIWALKSTGTTCYCSPDQNTDITIEGGDKVTVNADIDIASVTIGTAAGTGELEWSGNFNVDVNDAAGVVVASNGTVDRNGDNGAKFRFNNGSVSYTLSNEGTFEIGDIRLSGNNTLTLSGSSNITINDDLVITGNNAVFTNNSTGIVFINDDINTQNNIATLNNNGTINLVDITNSDPAEVTFNNNASSSLVINGVPDLDVQLSANGAGNSVTYNGGAQSILTPTNNYVDLVLTGSGTKSSTGNLDVQGNITISGTAVLDISTGSDNIDITGNWTSTGQAALTEGTQTVTFTGGAAQQLSVTGGETFYNVIINKSNNQLTINDNLTISNALTLTDGEIVTGTDTVIMMSTTAANLSGHSGASFIYGNLIRYIDNGGANTDTYEFPIGLGLGSSNYYRGDIINNGLTGLDYLSASVAAISETGDNTDDKITASQDGTDFTNIYADAQWQFKPNAAIGGSYGICLHTGNITGLTDNKFAPVKRPDGSTSYADFTTGAGTAIPASGASGRTVASGLAIRTGYTSFSLHAVAGGDTPLPIELLSFDAVLEGEAVDLTWKTASEVNNDFFTVERSSNGVEFEEVLKVDGAGNSNRILDYFETDYNPLSGVSYYRLKQTDYDGQYAYSDIVVVSSNAADNGSEEKIDFTVFPNPSDGLNINVRSNEAYKPWEEIHMSVADLNGKEYYSKVIITNNTGEFFTAIDPYERIPTGLYVVIGTAHEDYYSQILVVE